MDTNNQSHKENSFYEKRARMIVIAIAVAMLGILLILLKSELLQVLFGRIDSFEIETLYNQYKLYLSLIGGVMILMGTAVIMQLYLKYGFRREVQLDSAELDEPESGNKIDLSERDKKLKDIEDKLSELSKIQNGSFSILEEDRVKLVSELQSKLQNNAVDGLFNDLEERFQHNTKIKYSNEFIKEQYFEIKKRLKIEISELGRRGNTNLIIGSLTAIVGLVILGILVMPTGIQISDFSGLEVKPSTGVESNEFISLKEFIPRLSLVLLIEVFAYFFLKLYKSSLDEIKYYQNELTNIEVKFIALSAGQQSQEQDMVKYTVKNLSDTERNFVLQKGQTTVDLEKSRLDNQLMSEFVNTTIGSITSSDKGKKA